VTRQVTIIDPTHPLFGQIFPLIQPTSPQGPAYILIQLPTGRRRAVPRVATDLDGAPSPRPAPGPLPCISVRTILPLAHRVRAMVLAMEDCHADTHTAPGAAQPPTTQRPAPALAAAEPPAAATTGLVPRRLDPAHAHLRTDD
jgi:hypothetical protein